MGSLKDEITAAFAEMYDAFRADVLGENGSLRMFDNSGEILATITTGWNFKEVSEEQATGRIVELRVTDRAGADYTAVVFFGFGGIKYERESFHNPPAGNPAEWIWQIRPVGLDIEENYIIARTGEILATRNNDFLAWR